RPLSRRAFVAKVAGLLQRDVSVSLVDVVTVRQFNLYGELLELVGLSDPRLGAEPPWLYTATLRGRQRERKRALLEAWYYPMTLGRPLLPLPIWLNDELGVSLDLESSYEETCRVLRIA